MQGKKWDPFSQEAKSGAGAAGARGGKKRYNKYGDQEFEEPRGGPQGAAGGYYARGRGGPGGDRGGGRGGFNDRPQSSSFSYN